MVDRISFNPIEFSHSFAVFCPRWGGVLGGEKGMIDQLTLCGLQSVNNLSLIF